MSLINELKQMIKEKDEWVESDIILQEKSINCAILFARNFIIFHDLPLPRIEVSTDGEVGFTWRKKNRGIVNIVFNNEGSATWAAHIETERRTFKGRFSLINVR